MPRHNSRFADYRQSYCRESNIYFRRMQTIEPPVWLKSHSLDATIDNIHQDSFVLSSPCHCQLDVDQNDNLQRESIDNSVSHQDDEFEIIERDREINQECLHSHQLQTIDQPLIDLYSELHHQEPVCRARRQMRLSSTPPLAGDDEKPTLDGADGKTSISNSDLNPQYGPQQMNERDHLDLAAIRLRLERHVRKHLFWSRKAARKMSLLHIERAHVYISGLESLGERRHVYWDFEPYTSRSGLCTSGSSSPTGVTPTSTDSFVAMSPTGNEQIASSNYIWSFPIKGIERFLENAYESTMATTRSLELPGTSFVKSCHLCNGRARTKCSSCNAAGYEICYSCLGRGHERVLSARAPSSALSTSSTSSPTTSPVSFGVSRSQRSGADDSGANADSSSATCHTIDLFESDERTCAHCGGGGRRRCLKCAGLRYIACDGCAGKGRVRCFAKLVATWTVHTDEIITDDDSQQYRHQNDDEQDEKEPLHQILGERVKFVTGDLLYEERGAFLKQLDSFPVTSVNVASGALIAQHAEQLNKNGERLHSQRRTINAVEVHVIDYKYKHKSGQFLIYGNERKVFFPHYPCKTLCAIT